MRLLRRHHLAANISACKSLGEGYPSVLGSHNLSFPTTWDPFRCELTFSQSAYLSFPWCWSSRRPTFVTFQVRPNTDAFPESGIHSDPLCCLVAWCRRPRVLMSEFWKLQPLKFLPRSLTAKQWTCGASESFPTSCCAAIRLSTMKVTPTFLHRFLKVSLTFDVFFFHSAFI